MVQVSYPGVYVQEVSSGVRTITSVATSIAAFFGRTSKGPINKAMRVLSLSDYERRFGAAHAKSDLATSVQQFFHNGGTDCYVIRLAKGAKAASVTLRALDNTSVLLVTAKAEGAWGNTVRLEVDYDTPYPDETFNLRVIQEDSGAVVTSETFTGLSMDPHSPRFVPTFVSDSSDLVKVELDSGMGDITDSIATINDITDTFAGYSMSMRPLGDDAPAVRDAFVNDFFGATTPMSKLQISANEGSYVTVDLSVAPALPAGPGVTLANIQENLRTKIRDALVAVDPAADVTVELVQMHGATTPYLLKITSAFGERGSIRVRRAPSNDIAAALMLGVDQYGIEAVRRSNFRPAPTASLLRLGVAATPGDHAAITHIAVLPQNTFSVLTLDSVSVNLNTTDYDIRTTGATDPWYMNKAGESAATDDNNGVIEKLRIIASAINSNANLSYKAEVWGYHLAVKATQGTVNAIPATMQSGNGVFDGARTLNVRQYTLGDAGSGSFSVDGDVGDDGSAPGYDEYIGSETQQTGFHALDAVDLFNLMILPEDEEVSATTTMQLWGPASTYCSGKRAFLLIDPPKSWTSSDGRPAVAGDTSKINELRAKVVKDYCAVFYPRIKYAASGGVTKTIAPAGAIAGLMARTDATRGVWKAPAGIESGIRNVVGVGVELTDAENGVLNKKGVNCIRVFPNGIVNWGARTLDGDDDFGSEWKYIPVRRLALNIEESLYRGTRWVVFEPNDEPLWAKIRLNVSAYMMSLFRQSAFQGTSPKQAFFVKCDGDTTTQDDINKGIVNIIVGFAPLKPAEFVVISIQQMAGEL